MNAIGTAITREALQAGIYLRPLGNTVYLMPPYCITEKEMDQVYDFLVHMALYQAPGIGMKNLLESNGDQYLGLSQAIVISLPQAVWSSFSTRVPSV